MTFVEMGRGADGHGCSVDCPNVSNYVSSHGADLAKLLQHLVPKCLFPFVSWSTEEIPRIFGSDQHPYWSPLSDRVLVGAIPVRGRHQVEDLRKLGVTGVVSVLEAHELRDCACRQPIQPHEWREKGVETLRLDTQDLDPLSITNIAKGVEFIARKVLEGGRVYIHCNTGKGRSLTLAAAYLITREQRGLCDILEGLKVSRPQMKLTEEQLECLENYCRSLGTCESVEPHQELD